MRFSIRFSKFSITISVSPAVLIALAIGLI